MNIKLIVGVIIAIVLIVLLIIYRDKFKRIYVGAITLITGGVKTGKSNLSVEIARKKYRKVHRVWWLKTHILKEKIEEPLFYTNVVFSFGNWRNSNNLKGVKRKPHKLDKNVMQITRAILLREERLAYKSVVYIQESSLMSDNMDFTEETRNATLSLFNKLFGHETKGGYLIYDTQSILDNHYSIKRVVSSYFFIQKKINVLNLFHILFIRELANGEMLSSATNNFNEDVDFTTRMYIIWRSNFKHYDRYYFSYLTDNLNKSAEKFEYNSKFHCTFNPIYEDLMGGLPYSKARENDIKRKQEKYYRKKGVNKND